MLRQELFTKPRPYDTKFRRNIAKFRGISRNFAKVFSYFAKFREISRYEISSTTLAIIAQTGNQVVLCSNMKSSVNTVAGIVESIGTSEKSHFT
jgi:hypothetical protein